MLTREALLSRAEKLPGIPEAIEAFWDGDTQGWYVILTAIFPEVQEAKLIYKDVEIGVLQGKNADFRLFTGQVPPWTEALLAKEVGQEIAATWDIPFYFASPNYPEDDCPRWWQRDLSYPCRNCGIPLLQPESCPWHGLCYHCHLEESRNLRG